jgi:hypothetical protein
MGPASTGRCMSFHHEKYFRVSWWSLSCSGLYTKGGNRSFAAYAKLGFIIKRSRHSAARAFFSRSERLLRAQSDRCCNYSILHPQKFRCFTIGPWRFERLVAGSNSKQKITKWAMRRISAASFVRRYFNGLFEPDTLNNRLPKTCESL